MMPTNALIVLEEMETAEEAYREAKRQVEGGQINVFVQDAVDTSHLDVQTFAAKHRLR
jgi:hypothetical protein